ncbi:MAG: hypothetical protein K9M45_13260 [Kiritimatiellales bacterium]|nr:hypothetical protein [Kiritimatiellales bacterium]
MDTENAARPLPEKVMRRHTELILEILPDLVRLVTDEGRPADVLLSHYLREHKELGSRDRRFLAEAVFSFFRWYGWTFQKLNLSLAEACLVGAALDSTELHPSFQYMEKRFKLPYPLEPLGDKTLAEKLASLNECYKERENFQPLEISDLVFPEFGSVVDPDNALACIHEFQQRPPAWIRTRTDPTEILQTLEECKIASRQHEMLPGAVAVPGGANLNLALSPHSGQYVVQDIASQCVALVCTPEKDGDWWDCCAGAGGKAIHLMDLMQRTGKVLATDTRVPALKELKKRARQLGIRNILTHPHNVLYDPPLTKVFDGVLVDAPCSGWGTWSRNPDARWRSSRRDVIQHGSRQLKILCNAAMCVKPGGTLVYAVCTITRPETEEVLARFQDQNPDFKPTPFIHPLTGQETSGALQIWPWEAPGDGMFVARFTRDAD